MNEAHVQCADCGHCRVGIKFEWCHECEDFACERDTDCEAVKGVRG